LPSTSPFLVGWEFFQGLGFRFFNLSYCYY
jgi:hypothetical protein